MSGFIVGRGSSPERLYDELVADRGAVGNFSSFLRVCALHYENLIAQGLIPRDAGIPIRALDTGRVLGRLQQALPAAVPRQGEARPGKPALN